MKKIFITLFSFFFLQQGFTEDTNFEMDEEIPQTQKRVPYLFWKSNLDKKINNKKVEERETASRMFQASGEIWAGNDQQGVELNLLYKKIGFNLNHYNVNTEENEDEYSGPTSFAALYRLYGANLNEFFVGLLIGIKTNEKSHRQDSVYEDDDQKMFLMGLKGNLPMSEKWGISGHLHYFSEFKNRGYAWKAGLYYQLKLFQLNISGTGENIAGENAPADRDTSTIFGLSAFY